MLFDIDLQEYFRNRAQQAQIKGADFLLAYIAEEITERLKDIKRQFHHALDLHGYHGLVAKALKGQVHKITHIETQKIWFDTQIEGIDQLISPREKLFLPFKDVDLILSPLSLSTANDILAIFTQIRQCLVPDGLFLGIVAGAGSLRELRIALLEAESELYGGASPRIAPLMEIKDAGMLLQKAGFALPIVDRHEVTLRYKDMFALMEDLRNMGAQNTLCQRSKRPVSRRFFARANEIYKGKFQEADGRIPAHFSFLFMVGWTPHPSQQQPARKGSADVSLEKFLQHIKQDEN